MFKKPMRNRLNLLTKLKDPRTNWKYILIVVIMVLMVIVGVLSYQWRLMKEGVPLTNFPQIKKRETTIENKIHDWETYRNEKYGIEIKYPRDWKLLPPTPIGEPRSHTVFGEIIQLFPPKEIEKETYSEASYVTITIFKPYTFRNTIIDPSKLGLNEFVMQFQELFRPRIFPDKEPEIININFNGLPAVKNS
jgi:hypothetical protein